MSVFDYFRLTNLQKVRRLEDHLRELLPCHDCGAQAGQYCKPDYGCSPLSRRPGV